jgi:hypothetical protein
MEGDSMFTYLLRKLFEQTGTASVMTSAFYDNFVTNKYPPAATDIGGRVVPVSWSYTVGTGTYSVGTTDTVSGVVSLFIHRKGWKFISLFVSNNGQSASAGVGQTPVIGDGTTANKYMLASDFDATAAIGLVNGASYGYTPTSDVVVTLTWGATGVPVAGSLIFGTFLFIPGS